MSDPVPDLAELEKSFAQDPTSDAFLALSRAYLDQSRFMEAMVVCKKGIKNQPTSEEGRLLLAQVYSGQGKIPKAIDEVQKLLAQNESYGPAHALLGQLHERAGRFDAAVEAFKTALQHDPHNEEAQSALKAKGIAFEVGPTPEEIAAEQAAKEEAERQQALAAAQAAAALVASSTSESPTPTAAQPSLPPASLPPASLPPEHAGGQAMPTYFGYDPVAAQNERGKKLSFGFTFGLASILLVSIVGLVVFLKYTSAQKEEIASLLKKAKPEMTSGTTGGFLDAARDYEQALKIDDENSRALSSLAYLYTSLVTERGLGKTFGDKAKAARKAATEGAPGATLTLAANGLAEIADGKPAQALTTLAGRGEETPVLLMVKGAAQLASGDLSGVAQLIEAHKDVTNPTVLAWMGETERRLGHRLRARFFLDGAIKHSADHDMAHASRTLLVFEIKDLANVGAALDDIQSILDMGKDRVGRRQRGYALIGRSELGRLRDRPEEATRDFKTARSLLPRDPEVAYFQALGHFAHKEAAKGVEALSLATQLDKYRVQPWAALIARAADAKKFDLAAKAYADAKAIFPDSVEIALANAKLLRKRGRIKDTEAFLNTVVKTHDDARVHMELGRLLLIRKQTDKAIVKLTLAAKKAQRSPGRVRASVLTLLGRAKAKNNDINGAIEALGNAVRASPTYAPAYYYLGIAFASDSKTGPARESFQKCISLDKSSREAKFAKRRIDQLK